MKTCVLIPAYNEASEIGKIVEKVLALGLPVIVIDDGSADGTGAAASAAGAELITHPKNLGKGASLRDGFKHVVERTDYDAAVIMDADGQHLPSDIKNFLNAAVEGGYDIIAGNRMGSTRNMPAIRKATNIFMSLLLSALCGQRVPDTQCGFRLMTRKAMSVVTVESSKFDTESEILVDASRKGLKIGSVPVQTVYGSETSDIHPVKDTLRFFRLLFRLYCTKRK